MIAGEVSFTVVDNVFFGAFLALGVFGLILLVRHLYVAIGRVIHGEEEAERREGCAPQAVAVSGVV